jgi:hypothetical protein
MALVSAVILFAPGALILTPGVTAARDAHRMYVQDIGSWLFAGGR